MTRMTFAVGAAALALLTTAGTAMARDQIKIVGSSTVFPFSTVVAENFGQGGKFKTPVVESTGTGGGIKLFCEGVGEATPDITNASRAIKQSEVKTCADNGVKEIVEVKIGYDGIVIANSKAAQQSNFTREQLWKALAKQVPVDGKMVDNPYKTWNQVDSALPSKEISVFGPPPTSGTRDAFVELVMDEGCADVPEVKAIEDSKARQAACRTVREDGVYIEAGENDNLIVQRLDSNKDSYGIFGFSFLDQNRETIQGSEVGGVAPTFENIASGKYPVSRSLFFYVKKAHADVIPGLKEFVAEFVSDKAIGPDGYTVEKGLIPLPEAELKKVQDAATSMTAMTMK